MGYNMLPRVGAVGSRFSESGRGGCRRGNNPYGHPADCECRRAAQSVPYADPDIARDDYNDRVTVLEEAEMDRQQGSEW